jgi:hypothetical protein
MRHRFLAPLGGIGLALALVGTAQAHEGAGGNVGIGVAVGAPTALSLEVAPTPSTGLELAVGRWALAENDVYGHLVFKGNFAHLTYGPTVVVPVYIGLGGFLRERGPQSSTDFGARFPLGVNFDFTRTPIQIFAEVALEATLVSDLEPRPPLEVGGFAGVRVWF